MKKDYKKIMKLLNHLEIDVRNPSEEFLSRFFIQKFVYILKWLGIQFSNYDDYNFYLNGTYSPKLCQDYYNYLPLLDSGSKMGMETEMGKEMELQENDLEALEKYKQFILEHKFMEKSPYAFHEAISSIMYFQIKTPNLNENQIIDLVKNQKPHLSNKILIVSLNIIKKLQFKEEFITPDIQQEFNLWDQLND